MPFFLTCTYVHVNVLERERSDMEFKIKNNLAELTR